MPKGPPIHYSFLSDWDKTSKDPRNKTIMHNNHDSSMPESEVLRLVKDGVALLVKQTARTVAQADGTDRNRPLTKAYAALTGDRTQLIKIFKGIHQRNTKPHITARLTGDATLHFHLSANPNPPGTTNGFTYSVVSVSATETGGMVPPTVTRTVIPRRGSITQEVLDNEKRRLAEEEARRRNFEALPVGLLDD